MFVPEKDPERRQAAFHALMGIWRSKYGGREPSSEGH